MLPSFDPTYASGFGEEPAPSGGGIATGVGSACVVGILLLQLCRAYQCHRDSHEPTHWDWMCTSDPFASYSFLPLHVLAAVAFFAWCLNASGSSAIRFLLEIFIGCWSSCWFSPLHPFGATVGCRDEDKACVSWAHSGECEKNKDFMSRTCRHACRLCVAETEGQIVGWAAVGPRALALSGGAALVVLAGCRLLMVSLSEASQRRVLILANALSRPVVAVAALIMRTPLAPCVRLVLRLLRFLIFQVFRVLRFGASLATASCNCCRRRLIFALGGTVQLHQAAGSVAFDRQQLLHDRFD